MRGSSNSSQLAINYSKTSSKAAVLSQPGRLHFIQYTKRVKDAPLGFKCFPLGIQAVQLLCGGHRRGFCRAFALATRASCPCRRRQAWEVRFSLGSALVSTPCAFIEPHCLFPRTDRLAKAGVRRGSEFWLRQSPEAFAAPAMNSQLTIARANHMAIIG